MSDDQKQQSPRLNGAQIARFILGIILYLVLMGLREEFASVWARALAAGCAFTILVIFLLPLRKLIRRDL